LSMHSDGMDANDMPLPASSAQKRIVNAFLTNQFTNPEKQSIFTRLLDDAHTPASQLMLVELSPPSATPQPCISYEKPPPRLAVTERHPKKLCRGVEAHKEMPPHSKVKHTETLSRDTQGLTITGCDSEATHTERMQTELTRNVKPWKLSIKDGASLQCTDGAVRNEHRPQRPDSAQQGSISLVTARRSSRENPSHPFSSIQLCDVSARDGSRLSPDIDGSTSTSHGRDGSLNPQLASSVATHTSVRLLGHASQNDGKQQPASGAWAHAAGNKDKSLRDVLHSAFNSRPSVHPCQMNLPRSPHTPLTDQQLEALASPKLLFITDAFEAIHRLQRQYGAHEAESDSPPASPLGSASCTGQSSWQGSLITPTLAKCARSVSLPALTLSTDQQISSIGVSVQDSLLKSVDASQHCNAFDSTIERCVPSGATNSRSMGASVPGLTLMSAGTSEEPLAVKSDANGQRLSVTTPTWSRGHSCTQYPPSTHSAPAFEEGRKRNKEGGSGPLDRNSKDGRKGSFVNSCGEAPAVTLNEKGCAALSDQHADAQSRAFKDMAPSTRYDDTVV
jgi:hypothetical protein